MHSTAIIALALPLLTFASPMPDTVASVPSGTEPAATADNTDLITKLLNAPTFVDRQKLLKNEDHVFDFNKPASTDATTTGNGGHTVKADRKGFPALVGTGVSMTVGFLGPCGFNTPHVHPRGTEINIVVEGALVAEHQLENGLPLVRNRLEKFQATVFPQGAMHTEFNPLCTNATFVAAFPDEDPGVQQTAQSFLSFDDELITASLNEGGAFKGEDIGMLRAFVPKNVALGVEQCLKTCGLGQFKGQGASATASSATSSASASSSTKPSAYRA